MRTGGCLCGAVRAEASGPLGRMLECHCADCQKAVGGGAAHIVMAEKAGFAITREALASYTVTGASGGEVARFFCATCGAPTHSELSKYPDHVVLKVGLFDEDPGFTAEAAIWTASAPAWHQFAEGAPRAPGAP